MERRGWIGLLPRGNNRIHDLRTGENVPLHRIGRSAGGCASASTSPWDAGAAGKGTRPTQTVDDSELPIIASGISTGERCDHLFGAQARVKEGQAIGSVRQIRQCLCCDGSSIHLYGWYGCAHCQEL